MTTADSRPNVYGQRELAERLGVPLGTLRVWKQRGKLPPEDGTVSGFPMWFAATIDKWLDDKGE